MKKEKKKYLNLGLCFLALFVIWTVLIKVIDVKTVGPNNSLVGFATINSLILNLTGVHLALYTITDWLGLVPFVTAFAFATIGLFQWIKRRKILKVDYSLFVLGGFYIVVIATYFLFERVVVNYRPILIEGVLEASYPSSTTMLVLTVMPTAIIELKKRIKNNVLKNLVVATITTFIVFMVVARLVSGVHWFTDIVGGALFSTGMVLIYCFVNKLK